MLCVSNCAMVSENAFVASASVPRSQATRVQHVKTARYAMKFVHLQVVTLTLALRLLCWRITDKQVN